MDLDTIFKVIMILFGGVITFSSFVAAVVYLTDQHKKGIRSELKEDFENMNKKIDDFQADVNTRFDLMDQKHEKSDLAMCQNFLVNCLTNFERGIGDQAMIQRFWKQYDYYIGKGKNSYIKSRVKELEADGKLARLDQ